MFPKYFQTPFASNGDKAAINDLPQPDGTVSYQEGYGHDYETNPAANGGKFMFVERSQMNGVLNDITDNLKQWQEQGYYNYNPAIKYGIGGRCNYNDGTGLKAYVSTADNNTRVPSVNGVLQTGWLAIDSPTLDAKMVHRTILWGDGPVAWPTEVDLSEVVPPGRVALFFRARLKPAGTNGYTALHVSSSLDSPASANSIIGISDNSANLAVVSMASYIISNQKIFIGNKSPYDKVASQDLNLYYYIKLGEI